MAVRVVCTPIVARWSVAERSSSIFKSVSEVRCLLPPPPRRAPPGAVSGHYGEGSLVSSGPRSRCLPGLAWLGLAC
ncbi:hypothetical protein E2C01_033247 [Portunus trituberculatus]|uniref:Uncharacterized protein n=1 Tax=Portunus trituberculatus TaxID=210409 RepID=A0A5B7EZM8_PORTR|nr:hypothetical protein [Portunus trituberculatus]